MSGILHIYLISETALYFYFLCCTPQVFINVILARYSCLENSMEKGAWWATVHGVSNNHTTERLHLHFTFMHWRRKWQPTPVFLPGESQGQRSLVGCYLWGRTESDTTEAKAAAAAASWNEVGECFITRSF